MQSEAASLSREELATKVADKAAVLKAKFFDEALQYLTDARMRYEEGFGKGHPKIAWAIEGIAKLHQKRGNLREAMGAWDEAIGIREALQVRHRCRTAM